MYSDSLQREKLNKLHSKYKNIRMVVHQLRLKHLEVNNLRNNVIPKKDKEIAVKEKECEEYSRDILKLRKEFEAKSKELEAKTVAEAELTKEIDTQKCQLNVEIGSIVTWCTNI